MSAPRGVRGRSGTVSEQDRQQRHFYQLKCDAAEFYRANGVPLRVEGVLNQIYFEKPKDIYGYLGNYFSQFSHPAMISSLAARQVYDCRGDAALQVDVFCIIRNEEKHVCSVAMACVDECVLEQEDAVAISNHKQASVTKAIEWIREHLSPKVCGLDPVHQTHLDKMLSEFLTATYLEYKTALGRYRKSEEEEPKAEPVPEVTPPAPSNNKKGGDKGKKGSTMEKPLPPPEPWEPGLPGAMVAAAVSLAMAKCAARLAHLPLYTHIYTHTHRDMQSLDSVLLPTPLVTVLSCGKFSVGKLKLLEEIILLPSKTHTLSQIIEMARDVQREIRKISSSVGGKSGPVVVGVSEGGALQLGLERPEQALDMVTEACANLKIALGSDVHLALNCAGHKLIDYSKGRYEVMTGMLKSPSELVDLLVDLVEKYPAIIMLIDPFRKEDVEQWERLSSLIGQFCLLAADAAFRPCPCWRETRPLPPGVTWVLLKASSDVTLSELLHTLTVHGDGGVILSVNSEEIGDDTMVDVAVGLSVPFLKLGGLCGGGRMNKYNRLLRIEQELEEQGFLVERRNVILTCAGHQQEEEELSSQEEGLNKSPALK